MKNKIQVLEGGYIKLEGMLYRHTVLKELVGRTLDYEKEGDSVIVLVDDELRSERLICSQVFETTSLRKAMNIALAVANNKQQNKMGMFLGESGSGKTVSTFYLLHSIPNVIRLVCWSRMTPGALLSSLAGKLGLRQSGSYNDLMQRLQNKVSQKVIIVDEASELKQWQSFDALRFLVDEGNCAVIFVGTPLILQQFEGYSSSVYLKQARRRIGARKVHFQAPNISILEMALVPYLGQGISKPVLEAFQKVSDGNWGNIIEVAAQVSDILKKRQGLTLSVKLVKETAAVVLDDYK
jgi:DNA transposition AAA+ family ATPase